MSIPGAKQQGQDPQGHGAPVVNPVLWEVAVVTGWCCCGTSGACKGNTEETLCPSKQCAWLLLIAAVDCSLGGDMVPRVPPVPSSPTCHGGGTVCGSATRTDKRALANEGFRSMASKRYRLIGLQLLVTSSSQEYLRKAGLVCQV